MIKIETFNEDDNSFQIEMLLKGEAEQVTQQLISVFNRLYENCPELFELALLESKYTEDHT